MLLGFAALFFLVTQITSREFGLGDGGYRLTATFEQVGGLKPGAPVSMSGVTIGRVESISYDFNEYRARVMLRIEPKYDRIPDDSDAEHPDCGTARAASTSESARELRKPFSRTAIKSSSRNPPSCSRT